MSRALTLTLMFVSTLLAGVLAWLWIGPNGELRGIHWRPPSAVRPDLGSLSAGSIQVADADISRFVAILDRPVFSPTRRPPPPPPPPKTVAPARSDPLDTIHLYGLFSGAGGGGVIAKVDGKTRRLRVSETVGEWSLKEIKSREVVFTKAGENRVVPLLQASQAAMGATAPRPAFAAPTPAAVPTPPAPAVVQRQSPPQSGQQQQGAGAAKPAGPPPSNPFVIGGSR
jgi:hypothetical protein